MNNGKITTAEYMGYEILPEWQRQKINQAIAKRLRRLKRESDQGNKG